MEKNQKAESQEIDAKQRIRIERILLLPIMEEIGLKNKYFPEKYNIPSYELVGIIIAEFKRMKRMLDNQRRTIIDLRDKREKESQLMMEIFAGVKQVRNERKRV